MPLILPYPRKVFLIVQVLLFGMLASCAAHATESPLLEPPSDTPAPATLIPTRTALPAPTGIPGLEGWSVFNASALDIAVDGDAYILTLKRRALWFMDQRGVLIHEDAGGSFRITADVYTSKESDPSQPPGGDGTVQLSGLMVRSGSGGLENYVFIVVGDDGNGLSVETKNTVDSLSRYDGPSWGSASAELRICRVGSTFNLYRRAVGVDNPWEQAAAYDRPDLPETVQVGVNIYSDNTPDLQARIENLKVEPVSNEMDCEG